MAARILRLVTFRASREESENALATHRPYPESGAQEVLHLG